MLNPSILLPTDAEAMVNIYRFASLIITAQSRVLGGKGLWHGPLTFGAFRHITLILCAVDGKIGI